MFAFEQQFSHPAPAPATFVPAVGDWVKVFLPRLGVEHEGIVVNVARMYGGFQAAVAHNMKGRGVVQTYWHEFSEYQTVHLHRRAESPLHVQQILQRVYANLGKPYLLLGQNCQHFASFAFTGKAESPATRTVGGLAVVAIIAALFG
jgi:Lecithin retinol acyltransferase